MRTTDHVFVQVKGAGLLCRKLPSIFAPPINLNEGWIRELAISEDQPWLHWIVFLGFDDRF
jgi:hypothetical protein